jgi:hypothetical protein
LALLTSGEDASMLQTSLGLLGLGIVGSPPHA